MVARLLIQVAAQTSAKLMLVTNAREAHQVLQTHALRSVETVRIIRVMSAMMATLRMEMDALTLAKLSSTGHAQEAPLLLQILAETFVEMEKSCRDISQTLTVTTAIRFLTMAVQIPAPLRTFGHAVEALTLHLILAQTFVEIVL